MNLTIAAMPAYNEGHVIAEVILGCKKYVDKVIAVEDGSSGRKRKDSLGRASRQLDVMDLRIKCGMIQDYSCA